MSAKAPTQPAGGEEDVLDLTDPGSLWAKCVHESMTTFHLVIPKPGYTKEQLSKNPQVNPNDDLMRPWSVNFRDVGSNGLAECHLGKTGRAGEIMQRIGERYDRGESRVDKVRALYIAKAREGNRIPDAHLVEIKDFKLKPVPTISLKPGQNAHPHTYVTVQNFKNGTKQFRVELIVTGPVEQVALTTEPSVQISVAGAGSAAGKLVVPTQEGKKYVISVPVPLTMTRTEHRQDYWDDYTAGYTREIWTGGDVTLWARGLGSASGITKNVKLRAESWASGWLQSTPTYRYRHTHC